MRIDRIHFVETFKELAKKHNNEVPLDELQEKLLLDGYDSLQVKYMINQGLSNGIIYERRTRVYSYTDFEDNVKDWREELR